MFDENEIKKIKANLHAVSQEIPLDPMQFNAESEVRYEDTAAGIFDRMKSLQSNKFFIKEDEYREQMKALCDKLLDAKV